MPSVYRHRAEGRPRTWPAMVSCAACGAGRSRLRAAAGVRQRCRPCPTTLPDGTGYPVPRESRRPAVRCRSNPAGPRGCRSFRTGRGGGSAGRPVGRLMVLQRFDEPGPGDRAEHFVVAHFRLQLGADVGDDPELAVPHRRPFGIVEQDKAAGGEFFVFIVYRAGRRGPARRKPARARLPGPGAEQAR